MISCVSAGILPTVVSFEQLLAAMISPLEQEWSAHEILVSRASVGKLALSTGDRLAREDLITNELVIIPVLKHLGTRTTVDILAEHIDLFFAFARPRGKPSVRRDASINSTR